MNTKILHGPSILAFAVLLMAGSPVFAITAQESFTQSQFRREQAPLTDYEQRTGASDAWLLAFNRIDKPRAAAGRPALIESKELGAAAAKMALAMIRQDWLGPVMPNGQTIASFARASGYTGNLTNIHVYIMVTKGWTKGWNKGKAVPLFIATNGYSPTSKDPSQKYPTGLDWAVSDAAKGFGYCNVLVPFLSPSGQPDGVTDGSWTKEKRFRDSDYWGTIEVIVVSSDTPFSPGRPVGNSRDNNQVERLGAMIPVDVKVKKGNLIRGGIVGDARTLITPLRKISGILPKGVSFNKTTGKFYGIPRRKGTFLFTVQAKYKFIRQGTGDVLAPIGSLGTRTTQCRITVK